MQDLQYTITQCFIASFAHILGVKVYKVNNHDLVLGNENQVKEGEFMNLRILERPEEVI